MATMSEDNVVVQEGAKRGPGEWRQVRLGDVCSKIGSGATPRGGKGDYLQYGPYALVRSQNEWTTFRVPPRRLGVYRPTPRR